MISNPFEKKTQSGHVKSRVGENGPVDCQSDRKSPLPNLEIRKVGIVSRNYRHRFGNGYKDFSHVIPGVLKLLDDLGCDSVLFSPFSIIKRESYDPRVHFQGLRTVQGVFLEECMEKKDGKFKGGPNIVYSRTGTSWHEFCYCQWFGRLGGITREGLSGFAKTELPRRIFGNCCVLVCGETNGVKYSRKRGRVEDPYSIRAVIPPSAKIILNPIHDRMTRYEMKLKRNFLSENNRRVISVWNKGKIFKGGQMRDGKKRGWSIHHNGKEEFCPPIENEFGVEIGIVDT